MPSTIRVLLVSQYLRVGGAGRAAWNIYRALASVEEDTGVVPHFLFTRGLSESDRVTTGVRPFGRLRELLFWFQVLMWRIGPRLLLRPALPSLHSTAKVRTNFAVRSSFGEWDLVNLHWIGDATISIEEIGQLEPPVVWSLHDMWPYCGAEHLTQSERFREGYMGSNRPQGESGPDMNLRTWKRKLLSWTNSQSVVAPSSWAASNARESQLFRGREIVEIPHPIDTDFWAPEDPLNLTDTLPFKKARPFRLGIVAQKDAKDWAKGLDRLQGIFLALRSLSGLDENKFDVWIVGGRIPKIEIPGFALTDLGYIESQEDLRDFYRSLDLLLFPSAVDTYGLVAAEAQACGTPVVCFGATGAESVVEHRVTGYVAPAKDDVEFAKGILWSIDSPERLGSLAEEANRRALDSWSLGKVGWLYANYFRDLVSKHAGSEKG